MIVEIALIVQFLNVVFRHSLNIRRFYTKIRIVLFRFEILKTNLKKQIEFI